MTDLAKGPSSGYIFQFEVGLFELSKLKKGEVLSIEKGDDITKEDSKGLYLVTVQAKHSISSSGKNFGDTSSDLLKTLMLWITKIKSGILSNNNKFTAISNVDTPKNAIINFFGKKPNQDIINFFEKIKQQQIDKLSKTKTSGKSIQDTIKKIDFILSNKKEFEIVLNNFELKKFENIKEDILNSIHLESANTDIRDTYYELLYGWISTKCKERWLQDEDSKFTKKDFEDKYNSLRDKHPLANAIFRTKQTLNSLRGIDFETIDYTSLYIKQLDDINRNDEDKEEILKNAITDYLFRDIEVTYLIKNDSQFTEYEFEEFEKKCIDKWNEIRRQIAKENITSYTDEQLNDFACKIYDEVMINLEVKFQDYFGFNDTNKYIQNGTFLSLSNYPKIGWNPNWKKKYLKDD